MIRALLSLYTLKCVSSCKKYRYVTDEVMQTVAHRGNKYNIMHVVQYVHIRAHKRICVRVLSRSLLRRDFAYTSHHLNGHRRGCQSRIKGWQKLGHCHLCRNHVSGHVDGNYPFYHHEPSVADRDHPHSSYSVCRSRSSTLTRIINYYYIICILCFILILEYLLLLVIHYYLQYHRINSHVLINPEHYKKIYHRDSFQFIIIHRSQIIEE